MRYFSIVSLTQFFQYQRVYQFGQFRSFQRRSINSRKSFQRYRLAILLKLISNKTPSLYTLVKIDHESLNFFHAQTNTINLLQSSKQFNHIASPIFQKLHVELLLQISSSIIYNIYASFSHNISLQEDSVKLLIEHLLEEFFTNRNVFPQYPENTKIYPLEVSGAKIYNNNVTLSTLYSHGIINDGDRVELKLRHETFIGSLFKKNDGKLVIKYQSTEHRSVAAFIRSLVGYTNGQLYQSIYIRDKNWRELQQILSEKTELANKHSKLVVLSCGIVLLAVYALAKHSITNTLLTEMESEVELDSIYSLESIHVVSLDDRSIRTLTYPTETDTLNLNIDNYLPFLRAESRTRFWSKHLRDELLKLNGLVGFGYRANKMVFYANNTAIKLQILELLLPIYISTSLDDGFLNLKPSFIPFSAMQPNFNKLRIEMRKYKCTSSYTPNSGNSIGLSHTRFAICHKDTAAIVDWLWAMLNCFVLVEVDQIVLYEETGEKIYRQEILKGTVAGFFSDEDKNETYVLTAKHVIDRAEFSGIPAMISGETISRSVEKYSWEDAALYLIKQVGKNILPLQNHSLYLMLHEDIQAIVGKPQIFKYGAATAANNSNNHIEMEIESFAFDGWVYFAGVEQCTRGSGGKDPGQYLTDFIIAKGNETDSTGGDSGGPWYVKINGQYYVIGVHRTFVEFMKDGKRVPTSPGKRFFGATALCPLLEQLQYTNVNWINSTILVHFAINCNTLFGQAVYISGSKQEVGYWNADEARRLSWNEGNLWTIELYMNKDDILLEYKIFKGTGYDSQERESLVRTRPKWMLPYQVPATSIPYDAIYKDMNDLRVTKPHPIRYGMVQRYSFIQKFGWANLDERIVKMIAEFIGKKRVLEIGSGKGLLTHLLRGQGLDIVATDDGSETNLLDDNRFFYKAECLDALEAVAKYGSDASSPQFCPVLIASWSRIDVQYNFSGDQYIYIGEGFNDGVTKGFPDHKLWNCYGRKISENMGIAECIEEWIFLCKRKA